ncbi:histidine kinase [Pseudomonas putida]
MHRPYVLIHQARPSHQILLHQACNAQGVFDVRVTHNSADLNACLVRANAADLLILDHAMSVAAGMALLKSLTRQYAPRALLFVGQAEPGRLNLAQQARHQGLWVVAELPWPLSMPLLQRALLRLQGRPHLHPRPRIQTVMSPTHAH